MPYTIAELTEKLGVSERSIFRWIDLGLPTVPGGEKPILINGGELADFLAGKNAKKKCGALKHDEFFCFRCKAGRHAKRGSKRTENGKTSALCVECGAKMSRTNKPSHQDYMKPLFPT